VFEALAAVEAERSKRTLDFDIGCRVSRQPPVTLQTTHHVTKPCSVGLISCTSIVYYNYP